MTSPRTSSSHPIRIDEVPVPGTAGVIGITICPGKHQRGAHSGDWDRDLGADVRAIRDWGAAALLCLLPVWEMRSLRVDALPEVAAAAGIAYHHLPIGDYSVPDATAEASWGRIGPGLRRLLAAGGRLLVHCKGGLGRSGMMAARLLVELGCEPADAVRRVRAARPGAIETEEQEQHVLRQRPAPIPADPVAPTASTAPTVLERAKFRGRFLGCLLGGAVGDALGAPVEFMSLAEIRRRFGPEGIRDFAPVFGREGAITDDTQMTLFTAEGLIRAWVAGKGTGAVDPAPAVARAYARWLRTQGGRPRPGVVVGTEEDGWLFSRRELHARRAPGNTCLSALQGMEHAGDRAENDSKGCGGVMRVAPAGLYAWHGRSGESPQVAFDLGADLAALTHGHPTGYLSAGVLAVLVRELAGGAALPDALRTAKVCLTARPGHGETLAAVEAAERLAASGGDRSPEAIARLGAGWVAEEALAIGIYCALVARDFADGVLLAVNHGGDSDSTGSIAGNLLGAMLGSGAIPPAWLDRLELNGVIAKIAGDLFTLPGWGYDPSAKDQALSNAIWKRYPGF